jgi:hypothetical protein
MGEVIRRILRVPRDGVIRIDAVGVAPGTAVEVVVQSDPAAGDRALKAWRDAAARLRARRRARPSDAVIVAEVKAHRRAR